MRTAKKATRREVYSVIDGERDYQDGAIAGDPSRHDPGVDGEHSVGAYLTMLAAYVRKGQDAWTDHGGHEKALHVVRKIAAIAVHCMEDHGAPLRVPPSKERGKRQPPKRGMREPR